MPLRRKTHPNSVAKKSGSTHPSRLWIGEDCGATLASVIIINSVGGTGGGIFFSLPFVDEDATKAENYMVFF